MNLGMPVLLERPDLEGSVELCRELGLFFVELNMNIPDCCPEKLDPARVRALSAEAGIEFTLHLPEETDLGSFHPSIRRGHLETCEQAMRWASAAGVRLLNLHVNNGIYITLPSRRTWVYDEYKEDFLAYTEESFTRLSDLAVRLNLTICVENCRNFQLGFVAAAVGKIIALPRVGLTWDTGHDAETGGAENPLIFRHLDRLSHMHLHDYTGKDAHQVLYSGRAPIDDALDLAERRGLRVVVEVKTVESLRESIARLRRRYPAGTA